MSKLMKYAALLAISCSLIACASGPTPYQPLNSGKALGFEDTRIENDRFRVSYTANSPEEANDFALLRAAEIAKSEGYSHFQVISGGQTVNPGSSGPRPRVGVGLGTGGYRRGVGGSIGIGIPLGGQNEKVRQSIEVKLRQSAGTGPDFYAADEVIRNLSKP